MEKAGRVEATGHSPVSIALLGALQVTVDGHIVDLTAEKERILVATLAVAGDEGVSTLALIDELWEEPTAGSKGTLQTYVSNLRKRLRPQQWGAGQLVELNGQRYRFAPGSVSVDLIEFRSRLAGVRRILAQSEPDRVGALTAVTAALDIGHGAFDPDLVSGAGILTAEAARARDEWLEARWLWAELAIQTGRAAEVVGDLRAIVEQDPTEERFWRQLMLAYWKTGRQQMALEAYQEVRRVLGEELGVLPDPSLQDLERAILRQDPELGRPSEPARSDAPAPPAVPRRRGRIAAPPNSFVGRHNEIAHIRAAISVHALVTLRGAGGCGKTRLAREVARDIEDDFDGGAWWVAFGDIATVGDEGSGTEVVDAIAASVGLIRRGQADVDEALFDHLGEAPALLVLDNCEHVVDEVADVVAALLEHCPELKILTTTRESLRVVGEVTVPVEPLRVSDGGAGDTPGVTDAARLFFDRADPLDRELEADEESASMVEEICRRLDGVPLAIELAAALVETMPIVEILAELGEHRFELLTVGRRGVAEHHRTLAAVVDWSYDLLEPSEQQMFADVSMFPGSFSLASASAIAGAGGAASKRMLDGLVRKSIIETVRSGTGVERYRLLETLRQYGARRLDESGRIDDVGGRFISHFASLAEHKSYDPKTSVIEWFDELGPDIANLRFAIRLAIETDTIDEALSMIDAFHWYYNYVGSIADTERWLRALVSETGDGGPALTKGQLVLAYTSLASLANLRGSFGETGHWADLAVVAAREQGDVHRLIAALVVRGATAVFENRQDIAVEAFQESLELSTELGDRWGRAAALMFMAVGERRKAAHQRRIDPTSPWLERLTEIARRFERAYELFNQVGDDRGMALVLINLGRIEEHKGDISRAVLLCERGLDLAENYGDSMVSGLARLFRGRMALLEGNDALAVECFTQTLDHCESLERHRVLFSSAVEWLGIVASRHGDLEPLLRIAAATELYREAPPSAAMLPELHEAKQAVRSRLGEARAGELEGDGRRMEPEAVRALAIRAATAALGAPPS